MFEHPLVKNKNAGQNTPSIDINDYVKKLLLRIQNDIQRKNINLNEILGGFKGKSLS